MTGWFPEPFTRIFLPVYSAVYLLILGFKYMGFRRRHKTDPFVVRKDDRAQYLLEKYKLYLTILLIAGVVLYSFFPDCYRVLLPVWYLETGVLRLAGIILLIGSLVLIRVGEAHLKTSWRIGVDHQDTEVRLITTGIYRYSRNPIALGMVLALAGYFLVIPNALTLLILVAGYMVASLRIRIEEDYLAKNLGPEYEEYCRRTRKWI